MPSLKSNKNKWSLPADPSPEGSVCISVNVPDDAEWIAKFYGQLFMLSQQIWWDRDEAHTAKDVAARWLEVYLATLAGNCCDEGIPTIPPAYEIDLEFTLKIIRVLFDGTIQQLIDGVWDEPQGPYEIPEIPARTEPTSSERKCLAARNAALTWEEFYEQATDAYAEFNTQIAVVEELLNAIALVMGAFGQASAASNISFAQTLFETFYEAFGLVTGDVWNNAFTDEITCIFLAHAVDTSGVITFDYQAIIEDLHTLRYEAGLDADRQILLAQVEYLFGLVGSPGLDLTGATTIVSTYDCHYCEDWCYFINFGVSNGGFAAQGANSGVWTSGLGWQGQVFSSQNTRYQEVAKTFTSTYIHQITFGYDKVAGSGANNATALRVYNGATQVGVSTTNLQGLDLFQTITINGPVTKIYWALNNGTSGSANTFESLRITGHGDYNVGAGVECE